MFHLASHEYKGYKINKWGQREVYQASTRMSSRFVTHYSIPGIRNYAFDTLAEAKYHINQLTAPAGAKGANHVHRRKL